jgi:undecaprenyl-diphosphatase
MRALLHEFDHRLITSIQQWPDWVRPVMHFMTFVGQPAFTIGIGVIIILFGWLKMNMRLLLSGVSVIAVFYIGSLIKVLLQRDRPLTEYVAHMRFETYSLPSGHAVGSTVAYGLLAYFAWQALPHPWNYIVAGLLAVLVILIGISRVYLGAHFPSDVIAGWLLGLAGLAIIIFVIQPKL